MISESITLDSLASDLFQDDRLNNLEKCVVCFKSSHMLETMTIKSAAKIYQKLQQRKLRKIY